jgi:Tfp pilus assembly protein PilF
MNRCGRLGLFVALAVLGLGGCVTPREAPPPPPVSQNAAVVALVDRAQSDFRAGEIARSAAALERALNIEPRNPMLWHELARLRLAEGRYDQAEALAAKSNAWAARDDKRLRAANWRLIGEARAYRGDSAGALDAYTRAAELEK